MSRPSPSLKHSNSTVSLKPVPMWDSSDPDRHPPPLPLNPDSPKLQQVPSRVTSIFGPRSRPSSPTKGFNSNILPSSLSQTNMYNQEIVLKLSEIHEIVQQIDQVSRSSEQVIRKAENEVESLFKRSKDNANDLISLKDRIIQTEDILAGQVQKILEALTSAINNIGNSTTYNDIDAEDLKSLVALENTEVRDMMNKGNDKIENALKSQRENLVTPLQSMVELLSNFKDDSSSKLVSLLSALEEVNRSRQISSKAEESIMECIQSLESKTFRDTDKSVDRVMTTLKNVVDVINTNGQKTLDMASNLAEMIKSLAKEDTETDQKIIGKIDKLSADIHGMRENLEAQNGVDIIEKIIRSTQKDTIQGLADVELVLSQRTDSIMAALKTGSDIFNNIDDLRSTLNQANHSSHETTILQHEKLDIIMKEMHKISEKLAPLSTLTSVNQYVTEGNQQAVQSLLSRQEKIMNEIDTLREQKSELASEIAVMESVLKTRTEQFTKLEERAERFQQKLSEHVLSRSPVRKYSVQKPSRSTLDILTENSNGMRNTNPDSVNNSPVTLRVQNGVRESSESIISGCISQATVDPFTSDSSSIHNSPNSNRRTSWSRKLGTMFGSGKENELYIPKRGGMKKPGKGRSFSERL
ncbi:hypothetical protein V1511DRAFT_456153 [Dipodascopsis uninucleata]